MTQIGIVTLDARIVVKEILAVLRHVPDFRGEQHLWIANTREWPGKVIPSTDDHIDAAVLTLISRAEWPRTEIRDLTRLLTRFYQAGWCNDAIVHLLDRDPDGTRVPPFNDGKTKHDSGLLPYFRRRLNKWRDTELHSGHDDDYVPPTPVRRAVNFADWAHRMHAVHGAQLVGDPTRPRPTPNPPPSTRRHRYDNYSDQVNPYGTRRVTALEMLAVTRLLQQDARSRGGPTPIPVAPSEWPADTSHRLPPGNMLVLLRDRAVHHALRQFFGATDRDHWHTRALRTAITRAKNSGLVGRPITYPEVAELAATITKPDGTPVPHTTLTFILDRAR
ncbi:hypothetical protein [Umezawaea sp. Da 62-37]|uniref:hypothetical protein n=1 Tax=Umezawaea sp. Da 62-37 TaxID=3075927 RepID=UPI0028F6F2F4|nr:hypothetical protein [Umezawaea sp. Da 62-37]WNV82908.1 hypothetical protein RM788_32545 [Umezawaea sp. Da 62-37]